MSFKATETIEMDEQIFTHYGVSHPGLTRVDELTTCRL
jgi:hypothetical protein